MTDPVMEKLFHDAATYQHHLLYAMADRCEELGDAGRAAGYRWLAENRRWPCEEIDEGRTSQGGKVRAKSLGWGWFQTYEDVSDSSRLPFDVSVWMGEGHGHGGMYEQQRHALDAAAEALGQWLEETGGDPCPLCDGTGRTWKYDGDSNSRVARTCKECGGKKRRQVPKPRRKRGANQ